MSKLAVGNGAFLDPIPTVNLDAGFGANLQQALSTINDNFRKLISVPFLKGEHGENIQLLNLKISNSGTLTKLGEAIVRSLYGVNSTSWDPSLDDNFGGNIFYDNPEELDSTTFNCSSFANLSDTDHSIAFYGYVDRHPMQEQIILTSQQIFIFVDARVNYIENILKSQLTTFEDLSCALSITGKLQVDIDTGEILMDDPQTVFDVVKYNIIPTLYYDSGVKEWCWKINGAKSTISAQGLKGEDGADNNCVVCYGHKIDVGNVPYEVQIDSILTGSGLSNTQTAISSVREGQFAVVWYADNGKLNCTFGKVEGTTQKKVFVGQSPLSSAEYLNFDLLSAIGNTDLRVELDNIRNTENTTPVDTSPLACRGLWIPCAYIAAPLSNDGTYPPNGNGNVHMMWAGEQSSAPDVLHFGRVAYNYTKADAIPPETREEAHVDETSLKIHYDTVEKDFIEMGRTQQIASYQVKKTEFNNSPGRVVITDTSSTTGTQNINQYITINKNATDTKSVSINSNGTYLIGKTDNKVYSVEVESVRQVMSSEINIGNSNISITGKSIPEATLSPLTAQENINNLVAAQSIFINKENVLLNNGSLLIGSHKGGPSQFNAYVQHYANSTLYNYDYDNFLSHNILIAVSGSNIYWNILRPRYVSLIPVAIGGWLTIYTSKTSNSGRFIGSSSEPIELTKSDNYRHTFMSGKFGHTGLIIQDGTSNITVHSTENQINSIKTFNKIYYKTDDIPSKTTYGVATSMSGLWTKIGNVVDVKGKIFFTGIKAVYNSDNHRIDIQDKYHLTYHSLYNFILKNYTSIKFPLPVVLKTDSSYYVSTGNTFTVPEGVIKNSISGTSDSLDNHYNAHSGSIQNTLRSTSVQANNVLNGTAEFHFFGNTSFVKTSDYNSPTGAQLVLVPVEEDALGIEALPNIFSCTANLQLSGKKNWTFSAIPRSESLDALKNIETSGTKSRYGNSTGPVRLSDGEKADDTSFSLHHTYNIVRPVVKGNAASTIEDYPNVSSINTNSNVKLHAVTTIAPYVVRYLTFHFSYILDDDIYGFEDAYNIVGEHRNWDTENLPLSSAIQQVLEPDTNFQESAQVEYTNGGTSSGLTPTNPTNSTQTAYFKIMHYSNGAPTEFEMNINTNSDIQTEQGDIVYQGSRTYTATNGQVYCVIKYNVQQDDGHPDTYQFLDVVLCSTLEEANAVNASPGYKVINQTGLNTRYNFSV